MVSGKSDHHPKHIIEKLIQATTKYIDCQILLLIGSYLKRVNKRLKLSKEDNFKISYQILLRPSKATAAPQN